MKRIGKAPASAGLEAAPAPELSSDDIITTIFLCIDETVMPRAFVARTSDSNQLRLLVAGRELVNVVSVADKAALPGVYASLQKGEADKKAAAFVKAITDFAADGGALEIHPDTSAADFQSVENAGVRADLLRATFLAPKAKVAEVQPEADSVAAPANPAPKKAPAAKKAPAKAKAAAQAEPSDMLRGAYASFASFADTVILLSNTGAQIEASGASASSALSGIEETIVEDALAWSETTTPAIGAHALIVMRAEGLDGQCVCLLPDDGFLMVAFLPNRHLSRVFGAARQIESKGEGS